MKKRDDSSRLKIILITIGLTLFVILVVLPLTFSLFDGPQLGNAALIPIEGPITGNGDAGFGVSAVSSKDLVDFLQDAEDNPQVKVILLEINSPGGSAVASDEIASAVKKSKKPVVALIRETGASGAYWVASAADYIVANRMSITGSIGVLSSYLEFSGLMGDYNVTYERLVAGEKKDLGTPFKKLTTQERKILQEKLDKIHQFFIEEVAANRNLDASQVKALATGEFYLGVEALDLGLVDVLGDKDTAEEFMKQKYALERVDYITYKHEPSFLELLAVVFSDFSFKLGEGIGSAFLRLSAQEVWL